ncbi:hypothetical protein XENOCAPTIV_024209, partial [Xenoophorus captivus]
TYQHEYSLCLRRGPGSQTDQLAVCVACQSHRWKMHRFSPGRKSVHILAQRRPSPTERCAGKGLREAEEEACRVAQNAL